MSLSDRLRGIKPQGQTRPATRQRADGNGLDRGLLDEAGTFFLLDGSRPDDAEYAEAAQPDDTVPEPSDGRHDYVTGGRDYSYYNRARRPGASDRS